MIAFLVGAGSRRWWGGCFHPSGLIKRLVIPALGFGIALMNYGCLVHAGFAALCVLLMFLNPQHGEGMNYEVSPWYRNYGIWYASYSLFAWCTLGVFEYFVPGSIPVWKFFVPLLYPVGYHLAWIKYKTGVKFLEYPKGNWVIDGYTTIGELFLGGLIFLTFC